jgi:parallel beta-helix repeat protein
MIQNSKSEGIFVVEGEDTLLIEENTITNNYYGLVLVDSKGVYKNNEILDNYTAGILTEKNTTALIQNNIICKNMTTGIIIKDPSLPELRSNTITDNNMFQVQMERHAKTKWKQYETDNP